MSLIQLCLTSRPAHHATHANGFHDTMQTRQQATNVHMLLTPMKGANGRKLRGTVWCQADDRSAAGGDITAEFAAYVLESGASFPTQRRNPSHLMPPTEVVAAQLDALQRNDWPEADAGVTVAFAFTKPDGAEALLPGEVSNGAAAAWGGADPWLRFPEFSNQLHSPPFAVLLGFDSWQAISPMTFPQQREGQRALQAVEVTALRRPGDPLLTPTSRASGSKMRQYTFTFCLERINSGPFKDCWMTVGCRVGDYATV